MDDDVAVAVRRSPIIQMDRFVRQVKGELVRKRLRRRHDRHGVVVRQADALLEPGLRRIAVRNEFHDVLAEQHAQLGREVRDGPAVAGAWTERRSIAVKRLVVRQDRQIVEHHVAVGVVEMAVRVDQHAQRPGHLFRQRLAELARQTRILLRVDHQQPVRRFDRAGVEIAAGADPGMDAGGDSHKLRFG